MGVGGHELGNERDNSGDGLRVQMASDEWLRYGDGDNGGDGQRVCGSPSPNSLSQLLVRAAKLLHLLIWPVRCRYQYRGQRGSLSGKVDRKRRRCLPLKYQPIVPRLDSQSQT